MVAAKKINRYSWDADVLISWFKDDQHRCVQIEPVWQEVKKGEAMLILSSLCLTEVIENHPDCPEAEELFYKFRSHPNVRLFDVTELIARKAGEIRSAALSQHALSKFTSTPTKNIKTPDAIHIATAIVHKADMLHSYDLSNHSGTEVIKDQLKICPPRCLDGRRNLPMRGDIS